MPQLLDLRATWKVLRAGNPGWRSRSLREGQGALRLHLTAAPRTTAELAGRLREAGLQDVAVEQLVPGAPLVLVRGTRG